MWAREEWAVQAAGISGPQYIQLPKTFAASFIKSADNTQPRHKRMKMMRIGRERIAKDRYTTQDRPPNATRSGAFQRRGEGDVTP